MSLSAGVTLAVTSQFSLLDDIRTGIYGVRGDVQAVNQTIGMRSSAPIVVHFEGFNSRDKAFAEQVISQFIRRAKEAGGLIF